MSFAPDKDKKEGKRGKRSSAYWGDVKSKKSLGEGRKEIRSGAAKT